MQQCSHKHVAVPVSKDPNLVLLDGSGGSVIRACDDEVGDRGAS
ncbi:MAG TPA: hypothetical protein VGS27_05160 [Candidatus Sulfotelmatobacter sp.]|nr:hypothetical protein [Candidatus Sulfotelmatobacter sp.]